MASFASAFLWALLLSLVGKFVMAAPAFVQYHELMTKCLLVTSLGLFVIAMAAIAIRLFKRPTNRIR